MGALGGGPYGRHTALQFKCGVPNPSFDVVLLQGLDRVDKAIDAWTRALGALPVTNLSPAERKQKEQCDSELAAAKAMLEGLKANPKEPEGIARFGPSEREELPWKRAVAMIPRLIASQTWNSSVRRGCMHPLLNVILTLFSGCI